MNISMLKKIITNTIRKMVETCSFSKRIKALHMPLSKKEERRKLKRTAKTASESITNRQIVQLYLRKKKRFHLVKNLKWYPSGIWSCQSSLLFPWHLYMLKLWEFFRISFCVIKRLVLYYLFCLCSLCEQNVRDNKNAMPKISCVHNATRDE